MKTPAGLLLGEGGRHRMVSPGCALWVHLHVSGEATLLKDVRLNTAGSCMGPFLCDTGFLDPVAQSLRLPIGLELH